MMTESIKFPSASNKSKLSACPTTKVPQATDWIFQDFFNTMLNNSEYRNLPSIQISELFPNEKFLDNHHHAHYEHKEYNRYLSQTTFSEALHVVVANEHSTWDNNIDYRFCPTSTLVTTASADDQTSLPDLDNTKSGDEEEEESEEEEVDHIGTTFVQSDFSQLVNVAPVLIESTTSSCTTSTEDAMSFWDNTTTETMAVVHNSSINQTLKKRKSASSFSSLRSFMNVFSSSTISNKKSKLDHPSVTTATSTTTNNISSKKDTLSKKILKYFKRRS